MCSELFSPSASLFRIIIIRLFLFAIVLFQMYRVRVDMLQTFLSSIDLLIVFLSGNVPFQSLFRCVLFIFVIFQIFPFQNWRFKMFPFKCFLSRIILLQIFFFQILVAGCSVPVAKFFLLYTRIALLSPPPGLEGDLVWFTLGRSCPWRRSYPGRRRVAVECCLSIPRAMWISIYRYLIAQNSKHDYIYIYCIYIYIYIYI